MINKELLYKSKAIMSVMGKAAIAYGKIITLILIAFF